MGLRTVWKRVRSGIAHGKTRPCATVEPVWSLESERYTSV